MAPGSWLRPLPVVPSGSFPAPALLWRSGRSVPTVPTVRLRCLLLRAPGCSAGRPRSLLAAPSARPLVGEAGAAGSACHPPGIPKAKIKPGTEDAGGCGWQQRASP